jgi:hypothetical protein
MYIMSNCGCRLQGASAAWWPETGSRRIDALLASDFLFRCGVLRPWCSSFCWALSASCVAGLIPGFGLHRQKSKSMPTKPVVPTAGKPMSSM